MRSFIGTFICCLCGKRRVRVYDVLPDAPLCRPCERERNKAEAAMSCAHVFDFNGSGEVVCSKCGEGG